VKQVYALGGAATDNAMADPQRPIFESEDLELGPEGLPGPGHAVFSGR